ncbi:hypothetical protein RJT34_00811 [Clitoria ternatea]|uniref:BHLH domain-containing protein n=1 Tax=Clitoria ternatea TaxID=43366 RepID=A0AAN9Q097_CLITE
MNHPNQNTTSPTPTTFTNVNYNALINAHHEPNIILHDRGPGQIPLDSGICSDSHHHRCRHHRLHLQSSSSPPSLSSGAPFSGFLNDIIGIDLEDEEEEAEEELGVMKEMMYKIAAMQPVDIDPASIRRPKRRNVRISDDPQSVAARHRRERISEKIRILQRLVPGGTKMDTASMLDEAIRYIKFLKRQIRLLQSTPHSHQSPINCTINGAVMTTHNNPNNISSGLLLPTDGSDWGFAPSILQPSTTSSSSMNLPLGMEFNTKAHGYAGDPSSSFNNHEVISE